MINKCNILWIVLFYILFISSKERKVEHFNDYKSCCYHLGCHHPVCSELSKKDFKIVNNKNNNRDKSKDIVLPLPKPPSGPKLKKEGLLKPFGIKNKPLLIFSYLSSLNKKNYIILPHNIIQPLNVKMLKFNDVIEIKNLLYRVILFKPEKNLPLYIDKYIYNGKLKNKYSTTLYLYVKKEKKLFYYQVIIIKNNKPITFLKLIKNKPYQIGSIVTLMNNEIRYGPFILS